MKLRLFSLFLALLTSCSDPGDQQASLPLDADSEDQRPDVQIETHNNDSTQRPGENPEEIVGFLTGSLIFSANDKAISTSGQTHVTIGVQLDDDVLDTLDLFAVNRGGNVTTIKSIDIEGDHADQFALDYQPADGPLPVDQSVDFTVRFTPDTLGIKNAYVVIVTEEVGSPEGTTITQEFTYRLELKGQSNFAGKPPRPPAKLLLESGARDLLVERCRKVDLTLLDPFDRPSRLVKRAYQFTLTVRDDVSLTFYQDRDCQTELTGPATIARDEQRGSIFMKATHPNQIHISFVEQYGDLPTETVEHKAYRGALLQLTSIQDTVEKCDVQQGQDRTVALTIKNLGDRPADLRSVTGDQIVVPSSSACLLEPLNGDSTCVIEAALVTDEVGNKSWSGEINYSDPFRSDLTSNAVEGDYSVTAYPITQPRSASDYEFACNKKATPGELQPLASGEFLVHYANKQVSKLSERGVRLSTIDVGYEKYRSWHVNVDGDYLLYTSNRPRYIRKFSGQNGAHLGGRGAYATQVSLFASDDGKKFLVSRGQRISGNGTVGSPIIYRYTLQDYSEFVLGSAGVDDSSSELVDYTGNFYVTGIQVLFLDSVEKIQLRSKVSNSWRTHFFAYDGSGHGTSLPASVPHHTLFLTTASFSGNLGGYAGADAKCQAEADAEGWSGTFKAILRQEQITLTVPLILSPGRDAAFHTVNLPLFQSGSFLAYLTPAGGGGNLSFWSQGGSNCDTWTNGGTDDKRGTYGYWREFSSTTRSCGLAAKLLCINQ